MGAWISGDSHYAFIDFRTADEATQGFALQQISIHGNVSLIISHHAFRTWKLADPRMLLVPFLVQANYLLAIPIVSESLLFIWTYSDAWSDHEYQQQQKEDFHLNSPECFKRWELSSSHIIEY